MKTLELLSIIGSVVVVGITLGAVIIGSNANLRSELRTEMQELRAEVRAEVQKLRTDIRALEHRLTSLEQRLARAEGLIEGLRDAIVAYAHPGPGQAERSDVNSIETW